MNKWIAEFELEDGDTMPEHMDLEYKGAKIDFHCKPLKQEPCEDVISRQVVINLIRRCNSALEEPRIFDCHNAGVKFEQYVTELQPTKPQEKTGHWVEEITNEGGRKVFCSECGCPPPFEYISSGDVYSASGYGVINKTKFCPNCGIKMESEVEKNESI